MKVGPLFFQKANSESEGARPVYVGNIPHTTTKDQLVKVGESCLSVIGPSSKQFEGVKENRIQRNIVFSSCERQALLKMYELPMIKRPENQR